MKNTEKLKTRNNWKSASVILFWILVIGMPLHTMLVDKIIGSTVFSLGGLVNLWRDLIILFFFFCAVCMRFRQTLLTKTGIWMLCILAVMGVFWLCSGAPFMLKTNILRICVIPMLMVFIMQSFPMDEAMYDKLIWVLFLEGVGIALFGIFQVFILGEEFLTAIGYGVDKALHHSFYIGGWRGSQRLVGTFASPNNCGLYLTQMVVICWVNKDRLLRRWKLAYIGILLIVIGIVATFSRSAWVSLFVVLVLHFIMHEPNKKRLLNWRTAVVAVGGLVCLWLLDLVLLKSRMTNMIISSIRGVVTQSDASFMKHLEDLILPIGTILRNPLGFGFGTSGPVALNALGEGTRLVESSVWLVGYDMGIPGMLLYFSAYVLAIFGIFSKKDGYKRTAGFVALAALIIFFILPLHQNVESTFLIFTFMGLSRNPGLKSEGDKI